MRERKTPPSWVMQMVLPTTTRPAGGATERQIGELITSTAYIEKAIVSKLTAAHGRGKSVRPRAAVSLLTIAFRY